MAQKLKDIAVVFIIVLLLPYVLTTLFNGKNGQTEGKNRAVSEKIKIKAGSQTSETDLNSYLIGVLAGQVPYEYDEEVLMAQAVIARTQVKKKLQDKPKEPIVSEAVSLEKLEKSLGSSRFADYYGKLEDAVESTAGEILTYKDKPIEAPFHAVSGGRTRSGEEALGSKSYPYLKSVECKKDVEANGYLSLKTFTPKELINACTKTDKELKADVDNIFSQLVIKKKDSAGYVEKIQVGNKILSGEDFRKRLGLNSSCLNIQNFQGDVRIATRGLGHGLGMSQYTAQRMALSGKSYREILANFYKDTKISE